MEHRRTMIKHSAEHTEINKTIKNSVKTLELLKQKRIHETIEDNKNMKTLKKKMTPSRHRIQQLRDRNNNK